LVQKQARLCRDVLPHRVRLKLGIRDVDCDQVTDGDKADQPASFHHGHVAEPVYRHF